MPTTSCADEAAIERFYVATASIVERVLEVSGLTAVVTCDGSLDAAVAIAAREQEGVEWSTA